MRSGALSSGFFSRFVNGIHDTSRGHGYGVALSILDDEEEARDVARRLVRERRTDGIILMNPSASPLLLDHLVGSAFPFVVLGRTPIDEALSVDNDNVAVAADATGHLLGRDRGPVLLLNGPDHHTFTHDRAQGYRDAHRACGLEVHDGLVRFTSGTAEAALLETLRALDQRTPFRSVLAVSDAMAIGAMRALRERGLHVPRQVAVMGMNNDDVAEFTEPRLSSVELGAYDLGREAAQLLLEAVRGEIAAPRRRLVAHALAIRESA